MDLLKKLENYLSSKTDKNITIKLNVEIENLTDDKQTINNTSTDNIITKSNTCRIEDLRFIYTPSGKIVEPFIFVGEQKILLLKNNQMLTLANKNGIERTLPILKLSYPSRHLETEEELWWNTLPMMLAYYTNPEQYLTEPFLSLNNYASQYKGADPNAFLLRRRRIESWCIVNRDELINYNQCKPIADMIKDHCKTNQRLRIIAEKTKAEKIL